MQTCNLIIVGSNAYFNSIERNDRNSDRAGEYLYNLVHFIYRVDRNLVDIHKLLCRKTTALPDIYNPSQNVQ